MLDSSHLSEEPDFLGAMMTHFCLDVVDAVISHLEVLSSFELFLRLKKVDVLLVFD